MIAFLDGKLAHKDPTYLIINVGGVGYHVSISLSTFSKIKNEEKCKVYTYMHITDNSQALYGFVDSSEKAQFLSLISISGVGPNTALMVLSSLSPEELRRAILTDDVRTIQGVKGIGGKTAQRIILELKDKLGKEENLPDLDGKLGGSSYNTARSEALNALTTLGIPKNVAEKNIEKVFNTHGTDISLEEIIKHALKST